MDEGGSEVDHRFETAMGFTDAHGDALELFQLAAKVLNEMKPGLEIGINLN